MTLRTEAGESAVGSRREMLREPTGSPVSRYWSTMRLKISRERRSRPCIAERRSGAG